jgi:hypothetical protein
MPYRVSNAIVLPKDLKIAEGHQKKSAAAIFCSRAVLVGPEIVDRSSRVKRVLLADKRQCCQICS